jgi:predicted metal-dependent hydrolase
VRASPAAPASESRLTLDGVTLTVRVERKRIRHVNARLDGAVLRVSAPITISRADLDQAVGELGRRLVRRQRAREVNAEEDAATLARRVAHRFPRPPRIGGVSFVTTQRARWGSYSPASGAIRLHAALRHMPRWVLEAVVAHELGHAFYRSHGERFWALVRKACPETDRANAFLAGVSWLAGRWSELPPVERAQLAQGGEETETPAPAPVRRRPPAELDRIPPLEAWFLDAEEAEGGGDPEGGEPGERGPQ